MKAVRRDNPRAEQFKRLRQQRLPTSSHTPLVDRLNTTEAKIRKEIAIMKKCRHPHVVRLYEVIDDRTRDKIYMGESSFTLCFRLEARRWFPYIKPSPTQTFWRNLMALTFFSPPPV